MWIVTGATGFIGSALVWELNGAGRTDLIVSDHVTPAERPGPLKNRKYKEFVTANELLTLLNNPAFQKEVTGVFHMGACSSTTETNEEYLRKNNIEYTQELFKFCARHKIPFVYASSGATYGDGTKGFDDQSDPKIFKPLNLYGWSKLKFDIWALEQKEVPPRWYGLRFFNVYGPNENHKGEMASVVFKAYNQIRDSGRLKLFRSHNPEYKDGHQLRDFVYVKDITRWMHELMGNTQIPSGIYNMGYGTARTWMDLADATFANMIRPVNIDWIDVPAHIRNQYQYFTLAKMDKLLAQPISKPQWPLEKGVADYVKNYLQKPEPYL